MMQQTLKLCNCGCRGGDWPPAGDESSPLQILSDIFSVLQPILFYISFPVKPKVRIALAGFPLRGSAVSDAVNSPAGAAKVV